jgi:hypothetical protein
LLVTDASSITLFLNVTDRVSVTNSGNLLPPHLSAIGGSAFGRNPATDFTAFNPMGFTAFNLPKGERKKKFKKLIFSLTSFKERVY